MNHKEKQIRALYRGLKKRKYKRIVSLIISLTILTTLCFVKAKAQELPGKTLSQEAFFAVVLKYHPFARIADINIEKAKADLLLARGAFDPLASATVARKTFDGTEYYRHVQPELRIPAWYGIEIVAGAEYLEGQRTNNEETLGKTSYAGVVVPLAKNLLMDKRRAALQSAKVLRDLSEIEKQAALNNLLLEAMESYWDWAYRYQELKVIREAMLVSEKRLQLIKTAFRQGDRSALDTTEAQTQLQQFQFMLNDSWLHWQNASLNLSVYLWKENNEAYQLPPDTQPDSSWLHQNRYTGDLPTIDELLQTARLQHPELLQYPMKLEVLNIERKLKFQELLPKLDVKYNQLGKGYNVFNAKSGPLFNNNYQFGVGFAVPLRLSQGRGEYRKAKLKIEAIKLEQELKYIEVENKVKSCYNELITFAGQSALMEQAYKNFSTLQKGEELKFFNGESSLFLVNSRETKTLESLQKLLKTKTNYIKSLMKLKWASGQLWR